jgi:DNA-directed RNA polymerase specialized sigma24 family protein
MDETDSKEIIERLDKLIRVVALTGMKELTSTQKIALLSQAGFGPKEIAEIIGTSQNVVNVRLSEMRRAKSREIVIREKESVKNEETSRKTPEEGVM